MQKAARAYLQTQVTTTSQTDLLTMLYDGAIKFLNQAKDKIEERDVAAKGVLIGKALDVINELQCSLNKDKGGDLAENLNKLYFFCNARLLMANLKLETEPVDQVIQILQGLRSAYGQLSSGAAAPQPPGAQGAKPAGPSGPDLEAIAAKAAASRQQGEPAPKPGASGTPEAGRKQPAGNNGYPSKVIKFDKGQQDRQSGEKKPEEKQPESSQPENKAPKPGTMRGRAAAAYFNTPRS